MTSPANSNTKMHPATLAARRRAQKRAEILAADRKEREAERLARLVDEQAGDIVVKFTGR